MLQDKWIPSYTISSVLLSRVSSKVGFFEKMTNFYFLLFFDSWLSPYCQYTNPFDGSEPFAPFSRNYWRYLPFKQRTLYDHCSRLDQKVCHSTHFWINRSNFLNCLQWDLQQVLCTYFRWDFERFFWRDFHNLESVGQHLRSRLTTIEVLTALWPMLTSLKVIFGDF